MIYQKNLFLSLLLSLQVACAMPLAEQFKQAGYVEFCDTTHGATTYDSLYACFDELTKFLQTNQLYAQKMYSAKERFIRSKDKNYYGADFFGFYDESAVKARHQIAFYYSTHFHEFICFHYPELNQIPEIKRFLQACRTIQTPYSDVFENAAADLGLEKIFLSNSGHVPILLKVVKYLPAYTASRPHYDGTALTLLLDSTDNQSLLLCPYSSSYTVESFAAPLRTYSRCNNQNSVLLIPGTLLAEYTIYPTPHIVAQSSKMRYETIAFAMRPNYIHQKREFVSLPNFN
jgi:hypothetical protein